MLKIKLPGDEFFDEDRQEFVELNAVEVELEHSLFSLSKWESKWEKPFLGSDKKTPEETLSYIECMVVSPNPPENFLDRLSEKNVNEILEYINAKNTATWFAEAPGKGRTREVITSEIIYYWMISLQIPKEFEHWHLSRLFTQIKVLNEKNAPKKKMSRREVMSRNAALNAQRLAKHNTTG